MSLLMDALKKAEEAKRSAAGDKTSETPRELALTPLASEMVDSTPLNRPHQPSQSVTSPLPDLSLHTDLLDADLAAVSKPPTSKQRTSQPSPSLSPTAKAPTPSPRENIERETIRNVFSAKQSQGNRNGLWISLGVVAFIALGIGVYFWWQLQVVSNGSLTKLPPLVTQPDSGQTSAATTTHEQSRVHDLVLQQAKDVATTEDLKPTLEPAAAARSAPQASEPSARSNPKTVEKKLVPIASPTETNSSVRLSQSQPKSNQPLEQAYDALQAGRLDIAQRGYQQVLRNDPKNTDALLGLATIAARQENAELAYSLYVLALESDPNDATAQAGVIQTRGQTDPAQSESRLKTALANQPDSPSLLFALGNLYAREQRWGEAQQAYFRAYSTEPDNADFIFNLAVSLDQLHQNKLAMQYYQMALKAADTTTSPRAVAFDRKQVLNRIQELQP